MTYRYAVYSLLETFKQTFDDKKISATQVLFWVQFISNRLAYQHWEKRKSGIFLATFSPVSVVKDTSLHDRRYITIPGPLFDSKNERGVEYISYNIDTCCCQGPAYANVVFQPTTPREAKILYKNPFTKPTSSNPYFERRGERFYLLGIECINVTSVEVCLSSPMDASTVCDLDATMPFPDELVEIMMRQVLQLGQFAMLQPKELKNEGADMTVEDSKERQRAVPKSQTETGGQ